jgi:hypothetical protein
VERWLLDADVKKHDVGATATKPEAKSEAKPETKPEAKKPH